MVVTSSRHCCEHRSAGQAADRPRRRWRRRRHFPTAVTGLSQQENKSVGGGAPRPDRRSSAPPATSAVLLCLVVLLLLCCSRLPVAEAMAANIEANSNELGLLAHACASSYCGVGVNALDLWLSLEQVSPKHIVSVFTATLCRSAWFSIFSASVRARCDPRYRIRP